MSAKKLKHLLEDLASMSQYSVSCRCDYDYDFEFDGIDSEYIYFISYCQKCNKTDHAKFYLKEDSRKGKDKSGNHSLESDECVELVQSLECLAARVVDSALDSCECDEDYRHRFAFVHGKHIYFEVMCGKCKARELRRYHLKEY